MAIYFKTKLVKLEQRWARSCILGCPDLPRNYLTKVADEEIFIAQFNLEDISRKINNIYLPHRGMLYFFYDIERQTPIVRYQENIIYNEKDFSRVDFNDIPDVSYQLNKEYNISFIEKESPCFLLKEDENLKPGEIILLRLASLSKKNNGEIFDFIAFKDDLLNCDYSKIRLEIKR